MKKWNYFVLFLSNLSLLQSCCMGGKMEEKFQSHFKLTVQLYCRLNYCIFNDGYTKETSFTRLHNYLSQDSNISYFIKLTSDDYKAIKDQCQTNTLKGTRENMNRISWSLRFIWLIWTCSVTLKCDGGDNCVARWVNKFFTCVNLPWEFLSLFVKSLPDHYIRASSYEMKPSMQCTAQSIQNSSYNNTLTKFRAKQRLLPKDGNVPPTYQGQRPCVSDHDFSLPFLPFPHNWKEGLSKDRRSANNLHLIENKIAFFSLCCKTVLGEFFFHLNQSYQGQNTDGAKKCFTDPAVFNTGKDLAPGSSESRQCSHCKSTLRGRGTILFSTHGPVCFPSFDLSYFKYMKY